MSTNIYSHIALINSPEELEEVLPGLREFIENYEPNPNDAPSAGWGGYNPNIHTPEMYKRLGKWRQGKDFKTPKGKKSISEYMTNRVVSEETRQKLSDYWKGKANPRTQKMNHIKHHCPVHDKWMNIGNFKRYHKDCEITGKHTPSSLKGKPSNLSEEHRKAISERMKTRNITSAQRQAVADSNRRRTKRAHSKTPPIQM